ncbi:MAG: MgtC/SapB family protein [Bacteroidales bacterium]|nr:MgtC/SapB family protein [Bacteroidales bacterium]
MTPTLEFVIRLVVASLAGAIIGFERKYRAKGAGIGTHVLVATGAAMFMLVSQYGFEGAARFDAARVAAGVVSGIGFIGGGIILKVQNRVSGLTTAAGLWVTASLGLAIGGGLYILSGAALVIVLFWSIVTHTTASKVGKRQISVVLLAENKEPLIDLIKSLGNKIETYSLSKKDGSFKALVTLDVRHKDYTDVVEKLSSIPGVELESIE